MPSFMKKGTISRQLIFFFGCLSRGSPLQRTAEHIAERVSSLEAQVLEGRAALASTQADRDGMISELAAARKRIDQMEELKAGILEATAREGALRTHIAGIQSALKVGENQELCYRWFVSAKLEIWANVFLHSESFPTITSSACCMLFVHI